MKYVNHLIKYISLIGRNINKIIIIDDDENCFKLNKENGIKIKPFIDEINNDDKLFVLKNILKNIIQISYAFLQVIQAIPYLPPLLFTNSQKYFLFYLHYLNHLDWVVLNLYEKK